MEGHSSKSVKYSFIWASDTGTQGQAPFFASVLGLLTNLSHFALGTEGQRDKAKKLCEKSTFSARDRGTEGRTSKSVS